jgi:hypothetical protein
MDIRLHIALLLVIGCTATAMAAGKPEIEQVLLASVEKPFTVLAEATGDINADGIDDWVGLVLTERPPDNFQRVLVLTTNATGRLGLTGASLESRYYNDCGGNCWTEILIENGNFFISRSTKGGSGNFVEKLQFRRYRNAWRLVGLKTYRIDTVNDITTATDDNLLSGRLVTTVTHGISGGNPGPAKRTISVGRRQQSSIENFEP